MRPAVLLQNPARRTLTNQQSRDLVRALGAGTKPPVTLCCPEAVPLAPSSALACPAAEMDLAFITATSARTSSEPLRRVNDGNCSTKDKGDIFKVLVAAVAIAKARWASG